MPRVSFSANPQQESFYRKELLRERAWFDRVGMTVYLPSTKNMSEPQDGNRLRENMTKLQRAWRRVETRFFRQAKLVRHVAILQTYYCHCSVFGPEGKYRRPNRVFVRLRTSRDERLATEVLGHELVHLFLADFCEKRRCSYAEREGLTDAVLTNKPFRQLFPHYRIQSVGRVPHRLLHEVLPETGC